MKSTQKPIPTNPINVGKNIPAASVGHPFNPIKPVAPMVTAVYEDDSLYLRIFVFIDSKHKGTPTCASEDNDTVFYIDYDMHEEEPKNYDAWYFNIKWKCKHSDKITVLLRNKDPETSRGTEVVVLHTPR